MGVKIHLNLGRFSESGHKAIVYKTAAKQTTGKQKQMINKVYLPTDSKSQEAIQW